MGLLKKDKPGAALWASEPATTQEGQAVGHALLNSPCSSANTCLVSPSSISTDRCT